jgi:hypothetical protein
MERVRENILAPGFEMFRDAVAAYLAPEDSAVYSVPGAWDEVKLKAARFVEELDAADK